MKTWKNWAECLVFGSRTLLEQNRVNLFNENTLENFQRTFASVDLDFFLKNPEKNENSFFQFRKENSVWSCWGKIDSASFSLSSEIEVRADNVPQSSGIYFSGVFGCTWTLYERKIVLETCFTKMGNVKQHFRLSFKIFLNKDFQHSFPAPEIMFPSLH